MHRPEHLYTPTHPSPTLPSVTASKRLLIRRHTPTRQVGNTHCILAVDTVARPLHTRRSTTSKQLMPVCHHGYQLLTSEYYDSHHLHGRRCRVRRRDGIGGGGGERRLPARGARRPRREPPVNAAVVEAVVAARQHAHVLPARELGEAYHALRPRRPGQLEPLRVRHARDRLRQQRRPLPAPASATPPRAASFSSSSCSGGGGGLRAVARAPRDAERALEYDVERDGGDEAADEEREQDDGVGVERRHGEGTAAAILGDRQSAGDSWWHRRRRGRRARRHEEERPGGMVQPRRVHERATTTKQLS